MFNKYYQQELNALRELGSEFSRAHPALAPMLSGPASDPAGVPDRNPAQTERAVSAGAWGSTRHDGTGGSRVWLSLSWSWSFC